MEAFRAADRDTKIVMQVCNFDCKVLLKALKRCDPWSIEILADAGFGYWKDSARASELGS